MKSSSLCSFAKVITFFSMLFLMNVLSAQQFQNENTQPSLTKYGLYSIKTDIDSRLIAANNMVVDYIRQSTVLSRWNGIKDGGIDYWCSHKKKVVLNINWDDTPSYFPTDLTTYKNKLQSFLNMYADSIDLIVIENEELNNDTTHNLYHLGSVQNYINELKAALSVCTPLKVPVTNGGLATQVAASLKHYYDINGKKDSAQWLINQLGGVTADSTVWKRCDSLLNAYKTMALSYINLHWYEPKKGMTRITGVLQTLCNYITQQTGKTVITNESGTRSDSSFITQLMQQWSLVKPAYCILFDSDGSENNNGTLPLTNSAGALLPSGMAYRDYIGGGKACKQVITVTPSDFVNLCNGDTLTLTASSGFGTYLWNTGQTTQSITISATGNYSVKSVHKSCVAYSKAAAAVMMNAAPVKPIVTANPSPPTNLCADKMAKLTSNIASAYLWSTGEITKSINVHKAGNYTVTTTDKNGCKSTSNITAVIYQPCNPPGGLRVKGISLTNATLTWSPVSCAKGYQVQYRIKGIIPWTTSQITSGTTSSKVINGLTAAVYEWRMLTYCSYSPDTVKSVYANGPNFTISVHKDASDAVAASLNSFSVQLYPVPAKTIATVSVSHISNDLKIILMDVYGKVLWQNEKINSSVTNIPVAGLAGGIYLVVVKDKEHSKTLRLVKE